MNFDPIQLTRQLIDIDSTTYHEGPVAAFLAQFLTAQGYAVETTPVPQPADSKDTAERANLYAGRAGETPDLVFSTHLDTVPPFFGSREDADFIYGRGACDAKGIIAAQIGALERLTKAGFKVGLLLVAGEERDSAGAKVANLSPKGSRFLINGEPTDNRLALASKGALRVVLRTSGKMAHSAYPELGDNAINKMIVALGRVLQLELPATEDVGSSTLNIGVIEGGHAPNIVPDSAEAQLLVRLVGDSASTRKAIEDTVRGLAEVDFTLELPFVRMRRIDGVPTMVAAFTTDIPALSNWGEPLLLGPGSIHVAHTPGERLAKKELLQAIDIYTEVARRLLQ
ncbi:MAG TPA: M20/M25/M40 family metallo-hydrolase [Acidisarcina sp.]|nr:M20/M25/M40 family metallo-hydrolase [Acidisarcina sp.]